MKITANNGTALFDHNGRLFTVTFHRTLRLPEDGKTHELPPSLGTFPVKLVDDYKGKVPASWAEHGGVFIPLHAREALWLGFGGTECAVKVAAGKINAVNGKPWAQPMVAGVEDYMVAPSPQLWLDGFNAGIGIIKQFVAMPMGMGYTVEGQLTGEEKFGGLQLLVVPPKPGRIPDPPPPILRSASFGGGLGQSFDDSGQSFGSHTSISCSMNADQSFKPLSAFLANAEMGLAAGGTMTQKVYPDPHGIDVWDQTAAGRLYVHIVNAEMYEAITGEKPPAMPISAQQYVGPYFGLQDGLMGNVAPSEELSKLVKTVGEKDKEHGFTGQQDDSPVSEPNVVVYSSTATVRYGTW